MQRKSSLIFPCANMSRASPSEIMTKRCTLPLHGQNSTYHFHSNPRNLQYKFQFRSLCLTQISLAVISPHPDTILSPLVFMAMPTDHSPINCLSNSNSLVCCLIKTTMKNQASNRRIRVIKAYDWMFATTENLSRNTC